MEFNFQDVHGRSSPFFPPSRTARYHTGHVPPAINFEINGMVMNRELEKRILREEIIMEEILMHRRLAVLEAEVRRELMIGRQMADRESSNVTFEEEVVTRADCTGPSPFRLPGQLKQDYSGSGFFLPELKDSVESPLVAEPKGKVIVLFGTSNILLQARPDPNLYRLKRKAEISELGGDELPSGGLEKKRKEEWNCALCQVSATCEQGFNQHLQGKKHKNKEEKLRANKVVKKTCSAPLQKDAPPEVEGRMAEVEKCDRKSKKMEFKFWCDMCKIGAFTEVVMESHKKGKKHLAKLLKLGQNDEAVSTITVMAASSEGSENNVNDVEVEAKTGTADVRGSPSVISG